MFAFPKSGNDKQQPKNKKFQVDEISNFVVLLHYVLLYVLFLLAENNIS